MVYKIVQITSIILWLIVIHRWVDGIESAFCVWGWTFACLILNKEVIKEVFK